MKKFITIALAVAVLFSFAACQAEYKQVTGITVSYNGGDVLKGQTLDQSQFTGTVTYLSAPDAAYNGGYVIVKSTVDTTMTYEDGANLVVPASAATSPDAQVVITGATVYAYTPTKVVIDVTDAATAEVAASKAGASVPTDGVTVTAIYNNGKEMELDASYVTATVDASAAGEKTVTVDLAQSWKTAWNLLQVNGGIEIVGSWTVDVKAEEVVGTKITDITVEFAKDADGQPVKILYGSEAYNKNNFVVKASGTTADNKPANWTLSPSEFNLYVPSGIDENNRFNVVSKVTVTVQATADFTKTDEIEVTPVDYATDIRVWDGTSAVVEKVEFDSTDVGKAPSTAFASGTVVQVLKASEAAKGESATWSNQSTDVVYSVPVLEAKDTTVTISHKSENGETLDTSVAFTYKATT